MIKAIMTVLLLFYFLSANASEVITLGQTESVDSKTLKETLEYSVSLPESYGWAQDRRYPVLYVLDGFKHFDHSAASLNFLAAQGEIPEMIVVGISSSNRIRDFTQTDWKEAWNGGGGAKYFKQFLETELIPTVEKRYRTDGYRVISGSSAAGQFVLHCLSSTPELFQSYFVFSPSLDWDHNLPQRELEESLKAKDSLHAFLYVAHSDDTGIWLAYFEKLVQTLRTKSPRKFRWHSRAFPLETHRSIPLVAQIDALRNLYAGYRFHEDLYPLGIEYAKKHFEDLSETVGTTIAIPEQVVNGLGYAAMSAGRIDEAITLFQQNTKNNPYSENAYDSLAEAYSQAKKWKEARQAAKKAVDLATKSGSSNLSDYIKKLSKISEKIE